VTDQNAVEFVCGRALPIWFECRDALLEKDRETLNRILLRSIEGCSKHRVRSDYTNIALFNAVNLVLLGEAFDRPETLKEGLNRFHAITNAIWEHGAYEYTSPTYLAVNLEVLQMGLRYSKNAEARQVMRALLDCFWGELSFNSYTPSRRLGGSQSRSYNFVHGRGGTDRWSAFAGFWKEPGKESDNFLIEIANATVPIPAELQHQNGVFPRLIKQRWGRLHPEWRTFYATDKIALGTSGAEYPSLQDVPLAIDIADPKNDPSNKDIILPRCYFIPDGREDPFGISKYPTSTAGHQKALHLRHNWAGAQRTVDAIGVAIYSPKNLADPVVTNVQSHFVLRRPDSIQIGAKQVDLDALKVAPISLDKNPLVCFYGETAIGFRPLWGRSQNDMAAIPQLVDDGNKFELLRVTWDHHTSDKTVNPGCAFWVRIGHDLKTAESRKKWAEDFESAKPTKLEFSGDDFTIVVPGVDGEVRLVASNLTDASKKRIDIIPGPPVGILECNGTEYVRPILETLPWIKTYQESLLRQPRFVLNDKKTVFPIEAELGSGSELLKIKSSESSGGQYICVNEPFTWMLDVQKPGSYYIWAKVTTIDPQHDSTFVTLRKMDDESNTAIDWETDRFDWHLGVAPKGRWTRLNQDTSQNPVIFSLEKGIYQLVIEPREEDASIDRLVLTSDPNWKGTDLIE
ncbi:MAG: hypothetical protein ACRCUY_07630, partial [Thermoguttaceae bacterium]